MEGDPVTVGGIQHPETRVGEGVGIPSGSTLDRGTRAEKRMDDRPEEGGTLGAERHAFSRRQAAPDLLSSLPSPPLLR